MENPTIPQYSNKQFVTDVWQFIRPYKARFFFATFCRFISDVAALYAPFALAYIVTYLSTWHTGASLAPVWMIVLIWIAANFVYSFGHWAGKYFGFTLSEKAGIDAFDAGIEHLTALDSRWHEKESSGMKIKRIQRGREAVFRIIRIWYGNIIQIFVDFTGTIIVVSQSDSLIAGLLGVLIITYTSLAFSFNKKENATSHRVGIEEEKVQGLTFDLVGNIRTVRVLGLGRSLIQGLKESLARLYQALRRQVFWFRLQGLTISLWYGLFKITVYAYIIYGISKGQYEVGLLVLFHGYSVRVRESSQELAEISQDYIVAKNNMWRFQDTTSVPIRPGLSAPTDYPSNWSELQVKNLSFAYNMEQSVLRDISFRVKRGERIGIVGSSGAGKSTLFKLLLKEHEDFKGQIYLDKTPIQEISEGSYFKKVAVILQNTEVFNSSLRENIIIANPDAAKNEELFGHAVSVSHVSDFVQKLPEGYQTTIGEKGFKLSGGERQRVGIARAIFKQPDILLLDEATSHLDLESEEKIRESLHTVFQNITAIVIAHRLTTVREMDRILVIEDGKIVEEGSFIKLHKNKGRFYYLWEKQRL